MLTLEHAANPRMKFWEWQKIVGNLFELNGKRTGQFLNKKQTIIVSVILERIIIIVLSTERNGRRHCQVFLSLSDLLIVIHTDERCTFPCHLCFAVNVKRSWWVLQTYLLWYRESSLYGGHAQLSLCQQMCLLLAVSTVNTRV